jgi:transmembrane sensor
MLKEDVAVETADRIEAAAARWLARHEAGPLDEADARAFNDWCAGDPRRLGAFVRLQAVSARLDRAGALSGMPVRPRRSWVYPATGIAAALALAVWPASYAVHDLLHTQRFSTDIGQQYRAALPDGTLVELNTATKVAVELTPDAREVRLPRGEAMFEVAHDGKRPFVVKTRLADVRATGTVFSVCTEKGLEVAVREGTVEVMREGMLIARVAAGETFSMDKDGKVISHQSNQDDRITRELAWRDGKVAFAGETLAQAVDELNRYNREKVEIADPQTAAIHVGGYFRATDPEGFARALEKSFPVVAEVGDDKVVLRARPTA